MTLGSSSPEILLSITEIVGNRFEAGELGPGTIVGSAAYNLLMITALCIVSIKSSETRRIELYTVFMDLGQAKDLSLEEKAQLFAAKLTESMPRSRMQYRMQGIRMLTGSKSLFPNLFGKLQT
ncbi:unnamed protein product, partial [Rotaria sp. Silwood2]